MVKTLARLWVTGVVGLLLFVAGVSAAPVRAVATTGMVADLVRQVGGEDVRVEALMGPGVDPHLFKANAGDVLKLQRAQVVFYNGLMLEGKLVSVFERMARRQPHIYALADGVPEGRLLAAEDQADHADPHLWFDVDLWAQCVDVVVRGLSAVDPVRAEVYARRGDATRQRLQELHAWAQAKAAELPAERRILVTSHDAYNYFGRAYGFQVVGLQGISTVGEAALADMALLVDFIRERKIKAIFVETSVSPAAIRRIAQDARVQVGGELFSDALGAPGQILRGFDVGTYDGMVRYNLTTIVEALR
jgi:manganese/zinc/iron transport system substrate-binding protein